MEGDDICRALDTVTMQYSNVQECLVIGLVKSHLAGRNEPDFSSGLSSSLTICEKVPCEGPLPGIILEEGAAASPSLLGVPPSLLPLDR